MQDDTLCGNSIIGKRRKDVLSTARNRRVFFHISCIIDVMLRYPSCFQFCFMTWLWGRISIPERTEPRKRLDIIQTSLNGRNRRGRIGSHIDARGPTSPFQAAALHTSSWPQPPPAQHPHPLLQYSFLFQPRFTTERCRLLLSLASSGNDSGLTLPPLLVWVFPRDMLSGEAFSLSCWISLECFAHPFFLSRYGVHLKRGELFLSFPRWILSLPPFFAKPGERGLLSWDFYWFPCRFRCVCSLVQRQEEYYLKLEREKQQA